jgi:hypothetical protein
MRSLYRRESSTPCTSSIRGGGDHLGAALSAATPPHFITDCPKRKKLDSSSNKYNYTKRNDYSKDDDKKKYRFGDKKKKKF